MHEADIHDLSDDADYAAASKQGSSSMTRNGSSKHSASSDQEDAEIVYLKDNVTIHPTQYAAERISGRLKLIKQGSSLFMTWIPYKGQSSNARLSAGDKNLYTIKALPFSEIQSIRRHTPTIGWQYVIIVSSGLAFPPLYFYSGGVREFLATIKQHVLIVRSSEDANLFLVNNFQDPLQRTLSSLELPGSLANRIPSSSGSPSDGNLENKHTSEDGHSSSMQRSNKQKQKGHDPARDISINVLEKFSLVTRFARETSQLFRESLVDGHGPNEKRRTNWASKNHQSQEMTSNDVESVPKNVPVPSDPLEFDKLSLVWGKPRQHPLGLQEWSTFLDYEGRIVDPNALKKRIFYGGVEHNLRKEVWPFLLGYYSYDSTYAEREYAVSVKKSEYEKIKYQWQNISPEQAKRFTKFRERKGLIEKDVVRTDRSLSFYDGDDNPNGMSDLLSPMEFEYEKTLRLWEVLWTHYPSEHLHLYACIAILKRHRAKIMGEQMDFDTLLKFINELSGQIDLDRILRDAEALCVCAGENGAALIPPGTPPSLPIEDSSIYYHQDDEVL
ncbi:hypothetical protein M8C21_002441 [Ambrosia artemisiifolia]|uniref:Rab-GAP TBC domain-containing protein n=1 Tax=Ambrosia artemisiifolia TaxID=4212 RepID=A0AAD5BU46_AMBAR|nr:hypothetical protein M8C21_002441 [Ambrosia artemisiifolia]